MIKRKAMENKKIRNATPAVYDGIQYRSKLEARFARMLKENGIGFEYEQEHWELVPKQRWMGKCVRPITYTPDFVIGDVVVEIKGFRDNVYLVKRKLVIKYILEHRPEVTFVEAHTIGDMTKVVELIKSKQERQ